MALIPAAIEGALEAGPAISYGLSSLTAGGAARGVKRFFGGDHPVAQKSRKLVGRLYRQTFGSVKRKLEGLSTDNRGTTSGKSSLKKRKTAGRFKSKGGRSRYIAGGYGSLRFSGGRRRTRRRAPYRRRYRRKSLRKKRR